MRHLRVSNSLEAWMPDLATPGAYRSYAVIGFPSSRVDATSVAYRLRGLSNVAFCVDPLTVRATSWLTGISENDFVVGDNGGYSGVFCFAREGADPHHFLTNVQSALRDLGPVNLFAVGGPTVFQCAVDDWSEERLQLILIAIMAAGGVILFAVTRSLRISATAMAAIGLSQVIFLGAVCRLQIPLDMSLALVPPMMMGMGFSYAAHRALRRNSFAVLITCGLAAAAGIASYATADLTPVRHFALAGVPGLLLVWLVTVSLVQPDVRARRQRVRWISKCRGVAIFISSRFRLPIVACALIFSAAGISVAPFLRVESNPLLFFPVDSRVRRDFDTLNSRLTGMMPSQVVCEGGPNRDVIPMLVASQGMRKVLDVTPWVGGSARTYLCLADNDAVELLARQVRGWQIKASQKGSTLSWHGVAAQIHRSGTSIRKRSLESVPSMAILVGMVVLMRFGRWRLALIAAWVALMPVTRLVVIAVLLSWKLDPITLVIGSITTGIAVDDMLHLLTALRRRRSIQRAMIECWRPCAGSSLAATACFALFTLSPFGPTAQFGMLMAIATILAMLANQLLLPAALLEMRGARRKSKRFRKREERKTPRELLPCSHQHTR